VFLYAVLSVPTDLKPGERRPAIVCHHGAGGHPRYDLLGLEPGGTPDIYHRIGAEHAARGYVTLAPQGHFRFVRGRLQDIYRKAFSIGATDFGLFVRMHQRAAEWLQSLPFVDGERIGFHGLSYGGYTALWVPPLVPEYKVVVCAGHFNDWAAKTTDPEASTCYLWHNDDEMYNFDLLNRFNHSDLAALICPRPFMAEMGQQDAVTPRPWADREYAKVAALYAQLGLAERTEIHWGEGGHQIFAERSYPFLDRWLRGEE
jgi:dienelactone hydrolase